MFSSSFDAEGVIVFDQWAAYKRKRDRNDDDDDEEEEEIVKEEEMKAKKGYSARNYNGYDPEQAIESEWYRRYQEWDGSNRKSIFNSLDEDLGCLILNSRV